MVKQGHALHNVRRIIITHADLDHTGGLAQLKKATGAVACHTVEKILLDHPAQRQPAAWWLRPIFAIVRLWPSYRTTAVTPDELLVDGQTLPEGLLWFTRQGTPLVIFRCCTKKNVF